MPDPPNIELHLPSEFTSFDARPLFLATGRISGSVHLSNTARQVPDAVKIVLQGYYYNCIIPTMTTMAVNQNRFNAAANILHLTDVHEDDGSWLASSTSGDNSIGIPFYFQIPERTDCSLRRDSGQPFPPNQWDSHPSSISLAPSKITVYNYADSLAATRVIYEVKAFALKNNKVLSATSVEIKLFNSSAPSPPLCPTDFPGEYTLSQEKVLRTGLLVRTGKLCINLAEPAPLEISASRVDASTAMPLHFELLLSTASSFITHLNSSLFEASVTWRLKSSTVISVQHLEKLPTMKQLKRSVHAACVSNVSPPGRRKLRLTDWKAGNMKDSSGNSRGRSGSSPERAQAYTTDPVLWLSKPRQQAELCLPPTFSVPYLCRKYSFVIHIEVSAPIGRATFDLEVPVQVVYRIENQQITHDDTRLEGSIVGQENENRVDRQFDTSREEEVIVEERLPSYVP